MSVCYLFRLSIMYCDTNRWQQFVWNSFNRWLTIWCYGCWNYFLFFIERHENPYKYKIIIKFLSLYYGLEWVQSRPSRFWFKSHYGGRKVNNEYKAVHWFIRCWRFNKNYYDFQYSCTFGKRTWTQHYYAWSNGTWCRYWVQRRPIAFHHIILR